MHLGGEPHQTDSTFPIPERLASLPADYNCRGDDTNDCIKKQEVDEKLFFTKSQRRGDEGQGQKAVGPQCYENNFLLYGPQRGADAQRSEPVVSRQEERNLFVIMAPQRGADERYVEVTTNRDESKDIIVIMAPQRGADERYVEVTTNSGEGKHIFVIIAPGDTRRSLIWRNKTFLL